MSKGWHGPSARPGCASILARRKDKRKDDGDFAALRSWKLKFSDLAEDATGHFGIAQGVQLNLSTSHTAVCFHNPFQLNLTGQPLLRLHELLLITAPDATHSLLDRL